MLFKLAVSVATLVTILFLNSGKTSIATLIVGLLAILEIASSLSNILKTSSKIVLKKNNINITKEANYQYSVVGLFMQ